MSDTTTCKRCGARFEGDGAAENYREHQAGFHPAGAPAPEAAQATPALGKGGDKEARAAIADLGALVNSLADQVASLDERLRLAEEAVAARSGEGDQGGDASPAGDPDASATGEAGTPPEK